MTDNRNRRVLYIISPGRSGSTLLTLLLATHPDVATIGERQYLLSRRKGARNRDNYCHCGAYIPDCEFLESAYKAGRRRLSMFQRHVDYPAFRFASSKLGLRIAVRLADEAAYGQKRGILGRLMSYPFRAVCEANAAVVDFVLGSRGGTIFLDSSKALIHPVYMKKSGLFDVTLIHLSRDGRARFRSLLAYGRPFSEEGAASDVVRWNDRIKAMLEKWEGPVVRIRYEDLCDRPDDEIRRIAGEVGLDPNGVSLDFMANRGHMVGNPRVARAKTGRIVNQELWRTSLSPEALETFERIAGESNRSMGYLD